MKAVIMDMREMSLSKEVYDKKPGLFFTIFIYGLFALVITALVWAYFGRLDIVVRSHGIIRPHAQTAVIINAVSGEARSVYYYEGKMVRQGDVLFAINTFHLENERDILMEQLYNLNFELTSLELFRDSIEANQNLIGNFNQEFSSRFNTFLANISSIEHGTESQLYLFYETEQGLEESINHARFELRVLRAFENSILHGYDRFAGIHAAGGRSREVFNTFRNQYTRFVLEMESLGLQIGVTEYTLEGLNLIRDSINTGESLFYEYAVSVYRGMFEEYLFHLNQLEDNLRLAEENFDVYDALYLAGARSLAEKQAAELHMDNAYATLSEYRNSFLLSIESNIRTEENRLSQLENQAEVLHIGTLAGLSSQMMALEAAILEMNQQHSQIGLQRGAMFFMDDEAGEAVILRLNELNRTLGQINTIEQEIARLFMALTGLEAQIDESTVIAPMDGTVSVNSELTEGGFVPGGVHVLSIIPTREDNLNANIFINNNDIGQIAEGMTVRFDIAAMPRRDFGEITGEITRISADIATDEGMQGFFIVESEIEDRVYYDIQGQGVSLRVGMSFEARIVVEQQRILFYLLDRVNLMLRN